MKYTDELTVKGKIALVTGAARGLGRACALALAEAGADIAVGLRDIHADDGIVKEIEALGRKALPLQMDVAKMNEIRSAIEKIKSHFGRIDILVNNAGIAPENYIENVTEEDFDYTIDVNLISLTINISKAQAPLYSQLWIVGDATPNGWNIDAPNEMKVSPFNPYIFTYNEVLNAGEFKIPTTTGNWGADFYRPLTNHPPITDTSAVLTFGNANPPDDKW